MFVSYRWLCDYFGEKRPTPQEISEALIEYAFEVESVEEKDGDTVFDIKVLPDRAHDCLSHRGIAKEVAAILRLTFKDQTPPNPEISEEVPLVGIRIDADLFCRRYVGRIIEGITVGPSPAWLRERLAAIGEKSINNVVDATNFIMFDMGQPLHAFDASKVTSGKSGYTLSVRNAREGECFISLDGKELALSSDDAVIADTQGALALAGVKGGKRAEVEGNTTTLILEAANFNPTRVRKTAQRLGIRTESSKRFENEITPEFARIAMERLTALLREVAGSKMSRIGKITDVYPEPPAQRVLTVTAREVSDLLGVRVDDHDVGAVFNRLGLLWKLKNNGVPQGTRFEVTIPPERLDLAMRENLVREVGRLRGFAQLPDTALPASRSAYSSAREYYVMERIRDILVGEGFSEVYLRSFTKTGEVHVVNPLADDKRSLRANLTDGLDATLQKNGKNAPLLEFEEISLFEIGTVFLRAGEEIHLALAVGRPAKMKGYDPLKAINHARRVLSSALKAQCDGAVKQGAQRALLEINLTPLFADVADIGSEEIRAPRSRAAYRRVSPYPFIVRDVALFVPEKVSEQESAEVIRAAARGPFLAKGPTLFDVFTKKEPDGTARTSYAFRLVFQSPERTLTDAEANEIMEKVSKAIASHPGWVVR